MPPANTINILLAVTILLVALPSAHAFGAGDIPDFAYFNNKAFRHGDIENILETVVKSAGRAAAGGGILGFARKVMDNASGGSKFNKGDIKKVYFGNWLRDYSQAMDIAGLSKLSADTLVLVVSVLGFMAFGFATREFEVTADRLGVYLPVEHIDNPKGYAEKEGDARQFHPKLRPPVDPRELEIDERTGMKNYMATEDQGWDSSTAHIRRTFQACIEYGRRASGQEGADLYEAFRLLGTGLHTMEDLLAHSNWCEIGLRKMGYEDVFCHVGDNVYVQAPSGDRVPPLVTGTFGSADFMHSMLGEATDHISQASVTALNEQMAQTSQNNDTAERLSTLKKILSKVGGGNDKISQGEQLQAQSQAYHFNPDNVAPPEVQKQLLDLLRWRDDVYRDIIAKVEMVPGLSDLIDELSNALTAYVYTVIAPWLTPILTQATSALGEGSKAVIDSDDQYEVFNNADASDPSHSLLSKDHFGLILNEPAGKIAQIVVVNSVQLIVEAWSNNDDPNEVINRILEAFHHPYYASGSSQIQRQMYDELEKWVGGMGEEARDTMGKLTKVAVREGKNKREGDGSVEPGYGGCGHGSSASYGRKTQSSGYQSQSSYQTSGGYGGGQSHGSSQKPSYEGRNKSTYGVQDEYSRRTESTFGGRAESQGRNDGYSYGQRHDSAPNYGRNTESSYGSINQSSYGERNEPTYGRDTESSYGGTNESSYGGRTKSHGRRDESTYGRPDEPTYDRQEEPYESRQQTANSHDDPSYGSEVSYGDRSESFGGRNEPSYSRNESSYGGRSQFSGDYGRTESSEYGQQSEGYGRGGYGGGYGCRHDGGPPHEYGGRGDEYGRGGGGYGGSEEFGRPPPPQGFQGIRGGGYNPSYGGPDDTFGAERMNIRDDDDDRGHGRRHGHRGHHEERRKYDD
ncbi:Het-C-domain-containing protein [Guyanagaster necrorhizus]|uniref:Het-C-domain-containing protein n=1 Tax=Guyanagaster necrorhizus TaxID=856835 RepID=A0A9P8AYF8_9AGAR|nr:Het-C-domain-containing protein [Guyanagaster necrorhizus MCA 3950]KAG7452166.1 Het-C-domain-containing protein [Guyanagaster necrorhizus MCA 3950]